MQDINKVFLLGNLTRDAERPSERGPLKFSVATTYRFRSRDGEDREVVTFVDVDYWGKSNDMLVKGDRVFIEGRLKLDQWEDRETGAKRSKIRVDAEQVKPIDGRASPSPPLSSRSPRNDGGVKKPRKRAPVTTTAAKNADLDESEIPF